jgi:peptidoglycan/LPS O-acetylase OafA/YrhL
VLAAHFAGVGDGQLGVRCFFVLSGFLITSLLLAEAHRTGTIDVPNFMGRRAVRLLPVYFVFLAVMAIEQHSGVVRFPVGDWIAASTFTLNFVVELKDWTIFHLWSLSIEQQFYVLWPFLFLALAPWLRLRRLVVAFCGLLIFAVCFRVASGAVRFWIKPQPDLGPLQGVFSPGSTLAFVDVLGVGCVAACIMFQHSHRLQRLPGWLLSVLIAAATVMLISPSIEFGTSALRFGMLAGGYSISAIGCAILLAISVLHPNALPFRILNTRPLVFLGAISYSAYIWQQPFTHLWLQGWSPELRLLAVLGAAILSHYALERPLTGLRARLRPMASTPTA